MSNQFSEQHKSIALLVWRTVRDLALAFMIGSAATVIFEPFPVALIVLLPVTWVLFFQFAFADRGPNSEWALFSLHPLPRQTLALLLIAVVPMIAFVSAADGAYHSELTGAAKKIGEYFDRAQRTPIGKIKLFAVALILAPFSEEIFFRGRILGRFRQHMHVVPSVLLTALLFCLVHLRPGRLPIDMLVATFFGASMVLTGSAWAPIILHFAANLVFFNIPGVGKIYGKFQDAFSEPQLIALAVASGLALVVLGFALARLKPVPSAPPAAAVPVPAET